MRDVRHGRTLACENRVANRRLAVNDRPEGGRAGENAELEFPVKAVGRVDMLGPGPQLTAHRQRNRLSYSRSLPHRDLHGPVGRRRAPSE
jgi:hypothetical protein